MKNIIFDWSGVVRDTVTGQLWITNKIFEKYGVNPITVEEFRENWTQPVALFYEKYLPKGYDEGEREKLFRELQLDADCPKASSFPEVLNIIHKCKEKGYFLAVVSSDFTETLFPEVKEWGLENVFNEIIVDVANKLEAVENLIKGNNLNPEDAYFIGDSNHEIDVAQKLGIKSIAVTWGFTSEQKLRARNPDYVANTVEELKNIIL